MTEKYTPEKIAELIGKLRDHATVIRWLAEISDALTAVSAERDAEHARAERLEENRSSWIGDAMELVAKAEAERDRLHKAITEALDALDPTTGDGGAADEARRILRAALDQEGNDDE